jgi:hypothetical protein
MWDQLQMGTKWVQNSRQFRQHAMRCSNPIWRAGQGSNLRSGLKVRPGYRNELDLARVGRAHRTPEAPARSLAGTE